MELWKLNFDHKSKKKKNLMPATLLLKADKKAELKAKQICSSGPLVA